MFNISITVDSDDQIKAINQLDVNAYFDVFDERYKKFYKIIYKEACEDPISEISKVL